MQETTEEAILRIDDTLQRIETILKNKNKTTNETRIGALRRISNAISYMNKLHDFPTSTLCEFITIKNILLGIEGGD